MSNQALNNICKWLFSGRNLHLLYLYPLPCENPLPTSLCFITPSGRRSTSVLSSPSSTSPLMVGPPLHCFTSLMEQDSNGPLFIERSPIFEDHQLSHFGLRQRPWGGRCFSKRSHAIFLVRLPQRGKTFDFLRAFFSASPCIGKPFVCLDIVGTWLKLWVALFDLYRLGVAAKLRIFLCHRPSSAFRYYKFDVDHFQKR